MSGMLSSIPSIDAVKKTLDTFYSTQNAADRQSAHEWLLQVQNSPFAWELAINLLRTSDPNPVGMQLYGANALKNRLTKAWAECPPEHYDGLKMFLFQQLGDGKYSAVVAEKLSDCMALFIIQTTPDVWEDPIQQLVDNAYSVEESLGMPGNSLTPVLTSIQCIKAIPVQFRCLTMPLDRRSVVRTYLVDKIITVKECLSWCLSLSVKCSGLNLASGNLALVLHRAVSCLDSWMEFESDLNDWESVLQLALNLDLTKDENLLDTVVNMCVNLSANAALCQYSSVQEHLYRFAAAFGATFVDRASGEDTMLQRVLTRLISALFEHQARYFCLNYFVAGQTEVMKSALGLLLRVSLPPGQFPMDEDTSTLTPGAWISLYEELSLLMQEATSASSQSLLKVLQWLPCRLTVDQYVQLLRQELVPTYAHLATELLSKKLRYADGYLENSTAVYSSDELETFEQNRRDFCDVIACCHRVLNSGFYALIAPFLQLEKLKLNQLDIEVAFYALHAISNNNLSDDFLLQVFQLIAQIQQNNLLSGWKLSAPLANAVLRFIEAQASAILSNNWFPYVISFVLDHCTAVATAHHASITLCALTDQKDSALLEALATCSGEPCSSSAPSVSSFSPVITKLIHECALNDQLASDDRLRFLTSWTRIISLCPYEVVSQALTVYLKPIIDDLQGLADGTTPSRIPSHQILLEKIGFMATMIGNLNISPAASEGEMPSRMVNRALAHPVLMEVNRLLAIAPSLLARSSFEPVLVEKFCYLLKQTLVSLTDAAVSLVSGFVEVLSYLFSHPAGSRIHAFLPAKLLIKLFASQSDHHQILINLVNTFTRETLLVCNSEHSDLVESCLEFCHQIVKRHSEQLLWHPSLTAMGSPGTSTGSSSMLHPPPVPIELETMIRIALAGLTSFPEASVLKQASLFITELLGTHATQPLVIQFAESHGQEIVNRVFKVLSSAPLVSSVEHLADVLFTLVKYHGKRGNNLASWLAVLPPHKLVEAMMREQSNKRKFREFSKKYNFEVRRGQIQV